MLYKTIQAVPAMRVQSLLPLRSYLQKTWVFFYCWSLLSGCPGEKPASYIKPSQLMGVHLIIRNSYVFVIPSTLCFDLHLFILLLKERSPTLKCLRWLNTHHLTLDRRDWQHLFLTNTHNPGGGRCRTKSHGFVLENSVNQKDCGRQAF